MLACSPPQGDITDDDNDSDNGSFTQLVDDDQFSPMKYDAEEYEEEDELDVISEEKTFYDDESQSDFNKTPNVCEIAQTDSYLSK